jgi:hypothetical protein
LYEEEVSKRKIKTVFDTSAERRQVYIPFKRTGNLYEFDYVVSNTSLYYLDIIFDQREAIRYRIKIAYETE